MHSLRSCRRTQYGRSHSPKPQSCRRMRRSPHHRQNFISDRVFVCVMMVSLQGCRLQGDRFNASLQCNQVRQPKQDRAAQRSDSQSQTEDTNRTHLHHRADRQQKGVHSNRYHSSHVSRLWRHGQPDRRGAAVMQGQPDSRRGAMQLTGDLTQRSRHSLETNHQFQSISILQPQDPLACLDIAAHS